jgi:hypothetical protein
MKFFNKKKCDNCGAKDHLIPIEPILPEPDELDLHLFLCEPCLVDFSTPNLDYLYRAITPERPVLKQFDNNDYKESLR